jgi:transposase-like protein
MATIEVEVTCPNCNSKEVVKNGKDKNNKQRFLINYSRIGRQPHIKKLILKMAVNASGIRDTKKSR